MPWGPNSFRKYSWKDSGGGRSRNERERSWRKTDLKSPKEGDQTFVGRLRERGVFRLVGSACAALSCIALIVWLWMLPDCTQTEILVITFPGNVGVKRRFGFNRSRSTPASSSFSSRPVKFGFCAVISKFYASSGSWRSVAWINSVTSTFSA